MGCDLVHGLFAEVNDVGIFGTKEDALKEMKNYIVEGLEDHIDFVLEQESSNQSMTQVKDVYYRENPRYVIVERPIGLDEDCFDEMINSYYDSKGRSFQSNLSLCTEDGKVPSRYQVEQLVYFYHGLVKKMVPAIVLSSPEPQKAGAQAKGIDEKIYTVSYKSFDSNHMERCQISEEELFHAKEIPEMFIASDDVKISLKASFQSVSQLN